MHTKARRRTLFLAGIALLFAVAAVVVYSGVSASYSPSAGPITVETDTAPSTMPAANFSNLSSTRATSTATIHAAAASAGPVVSIDGQRVSVTLALTDVQQEKGLGGRSGLGDHEGMLFVFPTDGQHLFWMKDMNFSIDMIWFSSDGTVVYIQPDVSPETYPQAFGPQEPSRYVLEAPANFAATYGIKIGDRAVLPKL